ncbi:hypothetical protein CALCODRAFT_533883 [Calocera cornea HHB12733]|uniref:Uncharacterized protein n=1 Tax=Calocera cornea HHB12733 TaxID=1353952 RepID=A0A165I6X3_9BASI|nr:hypothetical protein CALCODRAFT_533883 [Calocera cornea HHB12733]
MGAQPRSGSLRPLDASTRTHEAGLPTRQRKVPAGGLQELADRHRSQPSSPPTAEDLQTTLSNTLQLALASTSATDSAQVFYNALDSVLTSYTQLTDPNQLPLHLRQIMRIIQFSRGAPADVIQLAFEQAIDQAFSSLRGNTDLPGLLRTIFVAGYRQYGQQLGDLPTPALALSSGELEAVMAVKGLRPTVDFSPVVLSPLSLIQDSQPTLTPPSAPLLPPVVPNWLALFDTVPSFGETIRTLDGFPVVVWGTGNYPRTLFHELPANPGALGRNIWPPRPTRYLNRDTHLSLKNDIEHWLDISPMKGHVQWSLLHRALRQSGCMIKNFHRIIPLPGSTGSNSFHYHFKSVSMWALFRGVWDGHMTIEKLPSNSASILDVDWTSVYQSTRSQPTTAAPTKGEDAPETSLPAKRKAKRSLKAQASQLDHPASPSSRLPQPATTALLPNEPAASPPTGVASTILPAVPMLVAPEPALPIAQIHGVPQPAAATVSPAEPAASPPEGLSSAILPALPLLVAPEPAPPISQAHGVPQPAEATVSPAEPAGSQPEGVSGTLLSAVPLLVAHEPALPIAPFCGVPQPAAPTVSPAEPTASQPQGVSSAILPALPLLVAPEPAPPLSQAHGVPQPAQATVSPAEPAGSQPEGVSGTLLSRLPLLVAPEPPPPIAHFPNVPQPAAPTVSPAEPTASQPQGVSSAILPALPLLVAPEPAPPIAHAHGVPQPAQATVSPTQPAVEQTEPASTQAKPPSPAEPRRSSRFKPPRPIRATTLPSSKKKESIPTFRSPVAAPLPLLKRKSDSAFPPPPSTEHARKRVRFAFDFSNDLDENDPRYVEDFNAEFERFWDGTIDPRSLPDRKDEQFSFAEWVRTEAVADSPLARPDTTIRAAYAAYRKSELASA